MNSNIMRLLVAILMMGSLTACQTNKHKASAPDDVGPYEEFKERVLAAAGDGATVEKVIDTLQTFAENRKVSVVIADFHNRMMYEDGQKVCYENGSCVEWNKISGTAAVWYKNSTGAFGMDTSALNTFPTDKYGNIVNDQGAILAHANDQEGIGRWAIGQLNLFASSAANGAIGAKISAEACEDGKCAGDTTFYQEGSKTQIGVKAGSSSVNNVKNAVSNGCPGCFGN